MLAPQKRPSQGQEWESCERAAGSAENYLGFEAGRCRKVGGGKAKLRSGHQIRRQDAGIARRALERRRGQGAREKTHFLAQVKEHSGNSERTNPAVQARQRKPALILQSRVPAATGRARRPGNHSRRVASGAPRDTSGFVLAPPDVVRLRGRRGLWTSRRRGAELAVVPDRFVSGPFCPAPEVSG